MDEITKKRIMSDAEIKRRKKLQSHISETTGALGLASLGAFSASKLPAAKFMSKTPRLRRLASSVNTKKMENIALGTSTAGAGIGGAGSFNFAAYTNAESRKKKPVVKSYEPEGVFGEIGKAADFEISKVGDWKTIDQREQSQRRSRKAMRGAGAAAGVSGGLVALGYHDGGDKAKYKRAGQTARSVNNWRKIKTNSTVLESKGVNRRAAKAFADLGRTTYKGLSASGKIGIAGLAGATAVGASAKGKHTYDQHKINQRRRARVRKSNESAFGISHD